jgi:hypothetical protein
LSIGELAVRTLRLTVPVYLASLLLALVPAVIGMIGLASVAADRPWRADLLGPNWLNLLIELATEAVNAGGSWGVGLMALSGLALIPLAALGQVIVYSYLAGGILDRLRPGVEVHGSFWVACRRWFWPLFGLSMLGSAVIVLLGMAVGLAASQVSRWISPDLSAIIQLAVQALVLGWLELARAIMVQQSQRSVGRCMLQAVRAFVRPLVLVLWLALALPLAGLLLAAINPPPTSDPYSIADLAKALMYGQLVAFLSGWTKVIRLAVATQLALTVRPSKILPAASIDAAPAE